jgi:integrase
MTRTAENACTPVEAWPQPDRDAWSRGLLPMDVFDPHVGYACRWRPTTHRMLEESYGHWVTWLRRSGHLGADQMPGERATHAALTTYHEDMRTRGLAEYSIAARLQRLGHTLMAMHPDQDWYWIVRAAARIRTRAQPKRDKRLFTQPTEDLVALGEALIAGAETADPTPAWWPASLARDGLTIALLAHRPLRRGNLASLTLGRHVEKCDNQWVIRIDGEETKNKEAIHCTWPETLVEPLERYLAVHRRSLLGSRASAVGEAGPLWISRQEGALGAGGIYGRVRHWTEKGLGLAINPHCFRYSAATTIATTDPASAADIQAVLGHTSLRSSDGYYNQAQMISAGDVYHQTIGDLRSGRRRKRA